MSEIKIYYLAKVAVYEHGIFWIGSDKKEGIRQADIAAQADSDAHHDWELRVYEVPDGNTDYESDPDHEVVYITRKKV